MNRNRNRKRLSLLTAALALFAASAARAAVPVTPADAPAIQRAIAAQKGRVVVLNFWATWCGPCVAEFPGLVKLSRKYKKKGLTVMAVSADMARDLDAKVKPFLAKQGADFPCFLQQSKDPEDFINAFDPKWQGELPHTLIYDRRGRLVRTLSRSLTPAEFEAAVAPLLKS